MKLDILKKGFYALAIGLVLASCQKMDRPKLGEIMYNPEPPEYNALKSFWSFENNTDDAGENKLRPQTVNVTYVAGAKGQAMNVTGNGYVRLTARDTVVYPNEFTGLPFDTLSNPGSLTVSFWMNEATRVTAGAQTVFAIADRTRFWGHFHVFLENHNGTDPTEARFKVHLQNDGVTTGAEQWIDVPASMILPGVFGKWTHIAFVYDANTSALSMYKDGIATGINNRILNNGNYGKLKFNTFGGVVWGTWPNLTSPSMTTGSEPWPVGFIGGLDQARIYNRALTAAEVNQLYTSKD